MACINVHYPGCDSALFIAMTKTLPVTNVSISVAVSVAAYSSGPTLIRPETRS